MNKPNEAATYIPSVHSWFLCPCYQITFLNLGAFFLLACAKENVDTVKKFVSEQVIKAGAVKQREAVQRFMVLWQTRYHVWPRMEERAQKKFHMYSENDKEDSQVGI